ncbi:TetR/AcrR family transcriptional regulator [Kutzneria sp. NPDC052558]|uniref:TetR/AcrR family transcriptional regulator n=1 Tax=Kutzneria sp. NPDC052558 TaxID=3364121 RepID=UPI0037C88243
MRPALISRAQVLDATLRLASEKGLSAVTMRSVATRLGVSPMALYRHVGDKQGLLDGLVERLMTEVAGAEENTDEDWRVPLRGLAANMRRTARQYPDLFILLFQRRAVTPAAVAARDAVYRALRAAGVAESELDRLERMISTFMLGFAASEAGGRFAGIDADVEFRYAEERIEQLIAAAVRG